MSLKQEIEKILDNYYYDGSYTKKQETIFDIIQEFEKIIDRMIEEESGGSINNVSDAVLLLKEVREELLK